MNVMNAHRKRRTSTDAKSSSDKLFKAKNCCWCKVVAISLLIVFMLILILSNVDFSGNNCHHKMLIENDNWLKITNGSVQEERGKRLPKSVFKLQCRQGEHECMLICSGKNTNNIYKELEPLLTQCGNAVELYLYNSNFPAGAMKPKFLEGSFLLKTLAIIDCNLMSIEAGAFQHDSVRMLENLHLINSKIPILSDNTFSGLSALRVLNITNEISASGFEGNQFLTSIASTLESFKMLQVPGTEFAYDVYDPLLWLQGKDLVRLREIDLSNNNFHDKLTGTTFANCKAVEVLKLSNCRMDHVAKDVFDPMLKSLKYLDLSLNDFKTLDVEMLTRLKTLRSLKLNSIKWNCSCNNIEFLAIAEKMSQYISGMKDLTCVTPLAKEGITFRMVVDQCNGTANNHSSTTVTSTQASTENGTVTAVEEEDTSSTDGEDTTEFSKETTTEMTTTRFTTTMMTTTRFTTTWFTTTRFTTTGTTPPPSTSSSTTSRPSYGTFVCRDMQTDFNRTIDLLLALFTFSVSLVSPTSVRLTTEYQDVGNFHLIYFANYTDALPRLKLPNWPVTSPRVVNNYLLVQNLTVDTAYVFCLAAKDRLSISPFDCKSIWMTASEANNKSWIQAKDKSWIIALFVLGVCLCILLGGLVVTATRYRRTLLTKIKRKNVASSVYGARGDRNNSRSSDTDSVSLKGHSSETLTASRQVNSKSTAMGQVNYEELDV